MKEIGGYEIVGRIGHGGMATVYEARDPRFDRRVAVKVLDPKLALDPEVQARFRSEAVIQAKLAHPHIVTVYDFVAEGETLAIVLEYVDGTTLERVIADAGGPLPVERTIEILDDVLGAVGWAHSQGLVHRDLKPSNIIVQQLGGRSFARVMDFGIAKILGAEKLRTATTAKMGTLAYMSPEHVQSPRNVDRRSDVYSLGVIFYEMLSGRLPFDADTEYGLMQQIVEKAPRQLPPAVREGAPGLAPVVERALAKRREDRYQSCDELLEALEAARSGGGAAVPATGPAAEGAAAPSAPPTGPSRGDEGRLGRLSPWALGAGAALALLAVLGLGMHLVSGSCGSGSGEAARELERERGAAAAPPSDDREPGPPQGDDASTAASDPAASAAPPSPPQAAPRPGTLVVRSSVAGDSVRIDGRGYGPTPVEAELAAGRHLVDVTRPGCEEHEEWVELGEGARRRVVAALVCPELEARERLASALLAGNEEVVERAAAGLREVLGPVAGGDGDLRRAREWLDEREAERRRVAEFEQPREEEQPQEEGLRAHLEAAISPEGNGPLRGEPMGAVDLDLVPGEAEVWIDGQRVGVADNFDGFPGYLWLPEGQWVVSFYHPGYETLVREFRIYDGVVIELDDHMVPGEATLPERVGLEGRAAAVAAPAGTVRDPRAGLLWTARDNGENIDWHDAERYCERLTLGGFTDWRLPTIDELEGLYDESASDDCTTGRKRERGGTFTCHPRLGIDLTGPAMWSSTKQGSSLAWSFFFLGGNRYDLAVDGDAGRALCVRRFGGR